MKVMSEPVKYETVEDIFSGRLRGNQLMISGINLGPEEARLLWNSPRLQEVNWLDLDDNDLGDVGVKELAECEYLINIQYLNLNNNGVGDEGVRFLAQSKYLAKLKRLHLKNNPIKGEGVIALFDSQTLDNLSTFQIHDGWTCKKREGWRYRPQG
jgi:Ran GTPase-activating protein (RanGAP) involved in mRNA processing and transport